MEKEIAALLVALQDTNREVRSQNDDLKIAFNLLNQYVKRISELEDKFKSLTTHPEALRGSETGQAPATPPTGTDSKPLSTEQRVESESVNVYHIGIIGEEKLVPKVVTQYVCDKCSGVDEVLDEADSPLKRALHHVQLLEAQVADLKMKYEAVTKLSEDRLKIKLRVDNLLDSLRGRPGNFTITRDELERKL